VVVVRVHGGAAVQPSVSLHGHELEGHLETERIETVALGVHALEEVAEQSHDVLLCQLATHFNEVLEDEDGFDVALLVFLQIQGAQLVHEEVLDEVELVDGHLDIAAAELLAGLEAEPGDDQVYHAIHLH